ncbi:hypothetical protein BN946_scf184962.g27 [Trametes cinnabarina]|uniref:Uncharacterized protein n=1 Tax=Pycnoporus cinnabarinus TaxID=5643 RepID=A0A060SIM0_PYCCI|nr:hypothetical protein BN946_scf184962.g27 [Trametes cinnabarina]
MGHANTPSVDAGDFHSPSDAAAGAQQHHPDHATAYKAPKKKKKAKKATSSVPQDAQSESSATAPESSTPAPRASSATSTPPKPPSSAPPAPDDAGWTKVETKKKPLPQNSTHDGQRPADASSTAPAQPLDVSTSDAAITTSVTTGNSSPVTERTEDESHQGPPDNKRTLAEKLLPKPRKTGVEECVLLLLLLPRFSFSHR